jgi:hypothetical protein
MLGRRHRCQPPSPSLPPQRHRRALPKPPPRRPRCRRHPSPRPTSTREKSCCDARSRWCAGRFSDRNRHPASLVADLPRRPIPDAQNPPAGAESSKSIATRMNPPILPGIRHRACRCCVTRTAPACGRCASGSGGGWWKAHPPAWKADRDSTFLCWPTHRPQLPPINFPSTRAARTAEQTKMVVPK